MNTVKAASLPLFLFKPYRLVFIAIIQPPLGASAIIGKTAFSAEFQLTNLRGWHLLRGVFVVMPLGFYPEVNSLDPC